MHVGAEGPISTSTHFLMTLEQNSHMKMYKFNHQKLFGCCLNYFSTFCMDAFTVSQLKTEAKVCRMTQIASFSANELVTLSASNTEGSYLDSYLDNYSHCNYTTADTEMSIYNT